MSNELGLKANNAIVSTVSFYALALQEAEARVERLGREHAVALRDVEIRAEQLQRDLKAANEVLVRQATGVPFDRSARLPLPACSDLNSVFNNARMEIEKLDWKLVDGPSFTIVVGPDEDGEQWRSQIEWSVTDG